MLDFARRLAPQAAGAALPVMAPRFGRMPDAVAATAAPQAAEEGIVGEPTAAPAPARQAAGPLAAPPGPAASPLPARVALPLSPAALPRAPAAPSTTLPTLRLERPAAHGEALEDADGASRPAARPMAELPADSHAPMREVTIETLRLAAEAAPSMPVDAAPATVPPGRPLSDAAIAMRGAAVAEQRQQSIARQPALSPARPIVELTIDRLEIRAPAQAPRPPAAAPRPVAAPSISLGDYLRQNGSGGARR